MELFSFLYSSATVKISDSSTTVSECEEFYFCYDDSWSQLFNKLQPIHNKTPESKVKLFLPVYIGLCNLRGKRFRAGSFRAKNGEWELKTVQKVGLGGGGRGEEKERSPSFLVFLCSETTQKRLLRRLNYLYLV